MEGARCLAELPLGAHAEDRVCCLDPPVYRRSAGPRLNSAQTRPDTGFFQTLCSCDRPSAVLHITGCLTNRALYAWVRLGSARRVRLDRGTGLRWRARLD